MVRKCTQCNTDELVNRSSTNKYKKNCPTCSAEIYFTDNEQYINWLNAYLKKQKIKLGIISIFVITGIIIITIGLSWVIEGVAH
jgi:peptide subunit release factor 1 (eRF1)